MLGIALLRADMEREAIARPGPAEWARSSTLAAISGAQPNLRDSGHSAPAPSLRMRQNTREPGADAGDLLDLGLAVDGVETALRDAKARATSRSFLIVLPKLMRSGVAPAASACSISGRLAQSKQDPSPREQLEDSPAPGWP